MLFRLGKNRLVPVLKINLGFFNRKDAKHAKML